MIRKFLLGIVINCLVLYVCQKLFNYLFNDFHFTGTISQFLLLGLILTLLNFLLKPILKFFFAPLIFLTLGIFSLIVNLIILKIAVYFVPQLEIKTSLTWLGASILISLFNSFFLK
ncbi:MAG: phage holin family protein [Minisyncoccia bacterium]